MTGSSFRLKPAEQRPAIIGLNVSVTNLPQLKCLALALILTSCAREDALSTKCDPAEAEIITRSGTGSISGQALKTLGGEVRHAAGNSVLLVPVMGVFPRSASAWGIR
jgi:hypothetical protein